MKNRIAIACAAVAAVAVAGVGGFAAAASGNDKDAKQHFVVVSTDPGGTQEQVYAVGPVTGVPTGNQISDTKDVWTFTDGSLTVEHITKHEKDSFDPKLCTGSFDETGTWRVVSGTGAYAHAQGNGTYTMHGKGSSKPGTCSENTPPDTILVVAVADGEMSI
jgi:hypothetical protein